MKLVRGNASFFIIGDHEVESSFTQLAEYGIELPPTSVFSIETNSFEYNLLQKKNCRLHSKKTQCLLECLHHLDFQNVKSKYQSEKIGLYINTYHDYVSSDFPSFISITKEKSLYKKFRDAIPPTHCFKDATGIVPGHIAIYHEIHGPTYAVTSISQNHLFEKASIDLKTGLIDLAVIGFVNSYDNEMTRAWHSHFSNGKKLTEAAGLILMTNETEIKLTIKNDDESYYGFLDGIISTKE